MSMVTSWNICLIAEWCLSFQEGAGSPKYSEKVGKWLLFCQTAKRQMTRCNSFGYIYMRRILLRSGWHLVSLYHVNKAEYLSEDKPNPNLERDT